MNKKLVRQLQSPMTEDNRHAILKTIADAQPEEHELVGLMQDLEVIKKVSNIAASYVSSGTARLSHDVSWDNLMGSTMIAEELVKLLQNLSVINYTQAVMLVTIALMKEEE